MFCKRCGNPIHPGEKFCAQCGLPIEQQPQIERVLLTITPQEAAQGCQKVIQKTGLSAPLRITLKPGVREGQTLVIRNACFAGTDGRQENRPLYVTVHIAGEAAGAGNTPKKKRKKWWIPVLAVLAVLLVIGIFAGGEEDLPRADAPHQATEISQDMPMVDEVVQMVVDDVNSAQQQYVDENGYIAVEDLEESLDAVCQVLEEAEPVTYYEKNDYCVYFECEDGYSYVYLPEMEEYALNGDDLRIVTVQPFYTENITNDTAKRYDHHALDENAAQIRDKYAQWDFFDVGSTADDNINDEEVTLERLLSLDDYKLILWQGHGGYSKTCGYFACTTTKATEDIREKYDSYFNKRYIITSTDGDMYLTEAFFQNCFEEGAFDGAVIYIGTCLSGYTQNFAQILLSKGAAAVYVNSETIYRSYNLKMLRAVGQNLCDGETVTQALESAKAQHGASDSVKDDDGTFTDVYVYCMAQEWAKDKTLQQIAERLLPQSEYLEPYRALLTDIVSDQAGTDTMFNNYTLYDLDTDGIPECIVEIGSSEADSMYVVYTVVEKEAVYLGTFGASHSILYGEVNGGLTVMSGHMGSETCRSVGLQDGVLSESLLYVAEVDGYWDEICNVRPLKLYDLNDESGLRWTGNPGYDNWSALEPARARVFP